MSVFDKVVAGWLSEVGDRLQPKIKEEILEDIKENINTYKIIDDSANSSVPSVNVRSKSAAEHGRGEEGHTFIAEVNQEMVNQETVNVNQYHVDPHVPKQHQEQQQQEEESSINNVSEQHSTIAQNVPQSHHLLDKIKEEVKEIEHEVKDKIEGHTEENQDEKEEEEKTHHEEKEEESQKEEFELKQDSQAVHEPIEKKEDVTTAAEIVTNSAISHKPQSTEAKVSSAASRRESRQTTLLHESVAPRLMTSENRSVCETLNFYKVDTTNFDFDLEKDIDVALQRLQKGENKYLFGPDAEERAAAEAERNAVAKYGSVTFPDDCTLTAAEQLDIKTIVRAMRHHFLFSTLDEETLMQCALSLPQTQYERNTHVLDAGNANDTMFFVLDGTATVTIPQVIKVHSVANDTQEEQKEQEGNVKAEEGVEKDVKLTDDEESHEGAEEEREKEEEESEAHKHVGLIEKVEQAVEHVIEGEHTEKEVEEDEEEEDEEEKEEHSEGAQNEQTVPCADVDNNIEADAPAAKEAAQESEDNEQGELVQFICMLERHDTFGELNILHDYFSTICVVANSPLRCACLTREAYNALTSPITKERVEKYTEFVRGSHAFEQCSEEECVKIASALRTENCVAGDKIIERGLPVNWVYVVVDGTLDVCGKDCLSSNSEQVPEEDEYDVQTRITPGQLAGQLEVLFGHVAAADVVVASKSATLGKLSCYHFNSLVNESVKDAMRA